MKVSFPLVVTIALGLVTVVSATEGGTAGSRSLRRNSSSDRDGSKHHRDSSSKKHSYSSRSHKKSYSSAKSYSSKSKKKWSSSGSKSHKGYHLFDVRFMRLYCSTVHHTHQHSDDTHTSSLQQTFDSINLPRNRPRVRGHPKPPKVGTPRPSHPRVPRGILGDRGMLCIRRRRMRFMTVLQLLRSLLVILKTSVHWLQLLLPQDWPIHWMKMDPLLFLVSIRYLELCICLYDMLTSCVIASHTSSYQRCV